MGITIYWDETMKGCKNMGIRSKFTNDITNKVGNSLLNIEEIKEKVTYPRHKRS